MASLHILLSISLIFISFRIAASALYPKEALPTKSGYLTVNSTSGSAIFYSYYEAQTPLNGTELSDTPILVWLQGGPGCSSMLANYFELGPWLVNQAVELEPNPNPWNKLFGVLFLDNPIGTGFSIAASPEEIPRNQHEVASHLITAIERFVSLDGSSKARPVYLTGESYAGKYLPSLGYYILKKNDALPAGESRINLAGVVIGNGVTDPEVQMTTFAVNCYELGLINEKQKALVENLQRQTIGLARAGRWAEASDGRTNILNTLTNLTGLATLYDFRRLTPYPNRVVVEFLNDAGVKRALGVEESTVFEMCSGDAAAALHEDVMKSARFMVEDLLVRKTRVLLYQGQCDLRDGVASTLAWVRLMDWEGTPRFLESEREIWRVDGGLAGYVQRWDTLSHAVVLNAGHLVPTDQSLNSQVMIQDWVLEKGLFSALG